MYTSFAAGSLIVLGTVISVLGLLLAASIALVLVGLGSIFAGGLLGILERRLAR